MPKNDNDEGRYVKKETVVIVAIAALFVGFIGGVVFGVYKSKSIAPVSVTENIQKGINKETIDMTQSLEAEILKHPENLSAWIQLGNIYFDGSRYDKAIWAYEQAVAIDPKNADVLTDMGVMYRRSGKPQKAVDAFDRAISANPGHETSRFNKGIVLMYDLKNQKSAIETWKGLVEINPMAKAPDGQSVNEWIRQFKLQNTNE